MSAYFFFSFQTYMQNDVQNYALHVFRKRAEANLSKPKSQLIYYDEFAKMIKNTYSDTTWTTPSLHQLYVELEDILLTLKSWDELEADEAVILLFGSYTDILKRIRRSANKNISPEPVLVKMVKNVLQKQPEPPARSFFEMLFYAPVVEERVQVIRGVANAIQYFLKLVIAEAITSSERNRRKRVNKYDVIYAFSKLKKASIQSYISKTTSAPENVPGPIAAGPIAAGPIAAGPIAARPTQFAALQANKNAAIINNLMRNKKNLLDQSDIWKTQVEQALWEAKTSRAEKKFAEDALAQCKKELEWVKRKKNIIASE